MDFVWVIKKTAIFFLQVLNRKLIRKSPRAQSKSFKKTKTCPQRRHVFLSWDFLKGSSTPRELTVRYQKLLNVRRCISFRKYHFGIPWVWFSGVFHLNLPKKFPKRKACIIKKNDQTSRQLVKTLERVIFSGIFLLQNSPEKFRFFGILSRKFCPETLVSACGNWISGIKTQPKRFNSEISSSEVGTEKTCARHFSWSLNGLTIWTPRGLFEATVCGKGKKQWPWVGSGGHGSGLQVLPQYQHDRSCDRTRLTKPSKFGSELGFFWILKIFCFWLVFWVLKLGVNFQVHILQRIGILPKKHQDFPIGFSRISGLIHLNLGHQDWYIVRLPGMACLWLEIILPRKLRFPEWWALEKDGKGNSL